MTELIIKNGIPYFKMGKHQIYQHNNGKFVLEKIEYNENRENTAYKCRVFLH
ncbi:hypothetical protein [Paenibacillus peoriae]|uniref:hypothetical protein n=1 Tax=Paenibacillus peoriae TaxID=59893 RepID=UPI0012D883DD|nr:hypothetical protein [Paenibacillus peoriae]